MKTLAKLSAVLFLLVFTTSFTWTNQSELTVHAWNSAVSGLSKVTDEVILTYNKSDICGLKSLGEVKVTEKRWFYFKNDLKAETIAELKKKASEKGGNIVFVDVSEKKGFGIMFTTTYTGYVFEKTE
jgi:hypothetical protein